MKVTAIDTETCLASNSEPIPTLVSIAVATDDDVILTRDRALDLSTGLFVFANAPFDLCVLRRRWPDLPVERLLAEGRVRDVLTRQKMLDAACGDRGHRYNLGAVAARYGLEVDKDDPWRLRYSELLDVPLADWPVGAVWYAGMDAKVTLEIFYRQQAFAKEMGVDLSCQALQARGHFALYQQTLCGLRVDPDKLAAVSDRLDAEIAEHAAVLTNAGLLRSNGTRDQKAAKAVMEAADCPKIYTPSGSVSMSAEALEIAKFPPGHPLDAYRRWGSKRTLKSKLVGRFEAAVRAGTLRTRYDEFKVTGRTGSSAPQGRTPINKLEPWQWVGDNLQNLPRSGGFRECIVPRDGRRFVISDWSGAELVTLAQTLLDLFGSSRLADALRRGMDVHALQACELLGVDYPDFDKQDPRHKEFRQLSKALNFGLPGGLGAARFCAFAKAAYGLEITEEQAVEYKRKWLLTWPEMQAYFGWINNQQRFDGRHRVTQKRAQLTRGGASFTEACNFMFQSLAATAAKHALWECHRRIGGQVLFVHDEIVTEAPQHCAEQVLQRQEKIMIDAFAVFCPDVPIRVESQISDCYTK